MYPGEERFSLTANLEALAMRELAERMRRE